MDRKKKFQNALVKSAQFKPVFEKELTTKITNLKNLGQRAEDQFWAMASAEFAISGSIAAATNAILTAETICTGAEAIMNDILSTLHDVLGIVAAHADITLVDEKTLYAPALTIACDGLYEEFKKLEEMLEAVYDLTAATNITTAFADLYTATKAEFEKFGYSFPTPITSFFSTGVTPAYTKPLIGAAINADGCLVLYNYVADGTPAQFANIAAGFHKVVAADLIVIEQLDVEAFEEYVGMPNLTVKATTAASMILEGDHSFGGVIPIIESEPATTFGEIFRLRKVAGTVTGT